MEKFNIDLSPLIEELVNIITCKISDQVLNSLNTIKKSPENEQLLSRKEAADFLGVSLPTLWTMTKNKTITGYRIGSNVRYKKSEILENLKAIK